MFTYTNNSIFQDNGSLDISIPTYVKRKADDDILYHLTSGNFCYVLSARQMGKSSLMVRTVDSLRNAGFRCISVDVSNFGSKNINLESWYFTFLYYIAKSLGLKEELKEWWPRRTYLTPVTKMTEFIKEVILEKVQDDVVIFIDEIDFLLSLDETQFNKKDFFAAIRSLYNERATNHALNRINFAILGVAAPSDLMEDPSSTPFNIGVPVHLSNFTFNEAKHLIKGFKHINTDREKLLQQILEWTNGQPVLTQAICKSIADNETYIPDIYNTVRKYVIQLFFSASSESVNSNIMHISERIMKNKYGARILDLYQRLLFNYKIIHEPSDPVQIHLKLTGLVIVQNRYLLINNEIYKLKFNSLWAEQMLERLDRPYASELNQWLRHKKDKYYLLEGQMLNDAMEWSENRTDLSEVEKQFLQHSTNEDRKRLQQKRKRVTVIAGGLLLAAIFMAILISGLYRGKLREQDKKERIEQHSKKLERKNDSLIEVKHKYRKALYQRDKALDRKDSALNELEKSEQKSDSLYEEEKKLKLKAEKQKQKTQSINEALNLANEADKLKFSDPTRALDLAHSAYQKSNYKILRKKLYEIYRNYTIYDTMQMDEQRPKLIRNFGDKIATLSNDDKLIFFDIKGRRLNTIQLKGRVKNFFPVNGNKIFIVKANECRIINQKGKYINHFGLSEGIYQIDFASEKNIFAYLKFQNRIFLMNTTGQKLAERNINDKILSISIQKNGEYIATGDDDGNLKLWDSELNLLASKSIHSSEILDIEIGPEGKYVLTASADNNIRKWKKDRQHIKFVTRYRGHDAPVRNITFSENGRFFASGSQDQTAILWNRDGERLQRLRGHKRSVNQVVFSDNDEYIITASFNDNAKIWKNYFDYYDNNNQKIDVINKDTSRRNYAYNSGKKLEFRDYKHNLLDSVYLNIPTYKQLNFQPDSEEVMILKKSGNMCLYNITSGNLQKFNKNYSGEIEATGYFPDGKIALGIEQEGVKIFDKNFNETQFYPLDMNEISSLSISSDGKYMAAGSDKGRIYMFSLNENERSVIDAHDDIIQEIEFLPGKHQFISASHDKTCKLWNASGELINVYTGHEAPVVSIAVNKSGNKLASASWDNTCRVWEIKGDEFQRFKFNKQVRNLFFYPDNKHLMILYGDKRLIMAETKKVLDKIL